MFAGVPPQCTIVTGLRGAGKTRWIQRQVDEILAHQPGAWCAVVVAEQGRSRWEEFARMRPTLRVKVLAVPCACCPALVGLTTAVRAVIEENQAGHLFIELPAIAAAGLLSEFDQVLGWPRRVVTIWNDSPAARAPHAGPVFFQMLAERSDRVLVSVPTARRDHPRRRRDSP